MQCSKDAYDEAGSNELALRLCLGRHANACMAPVMAKPSALELIVARALEHWLRKPRMSQPKTKNVPKDKRKPLK